jgi:hypothetical protein
VWLLAPVAALVLLAACPPPATALEAGDAAPALAAKDVRGRALAVPASGRVLLLSFASPADGEAVGEITRAIRVEHPELEIVSFIDLSGFPGFARGVVTREIEQRHEQAVRKTRAAFDEAGKRAPEDLDARIHIVPDFDARSCARYGAGDGGQRPVIVVVGANGRVETILAPARALSDVKAAVERALNAHPPR